jgi:hypothetical protein
MEKERIKPDENTLMGELRLTAAEKLLIAIVVLGLILILLVLISYQPAISSLLTGSTQPTTSQ